MDQEEYYTAPSDEVFEDIKRAATKIWSGYDDPYRSEKLARIANVQNIKDNAWLLVAMFDHVNQAKLLDMMKPKTAELIIKARGY